MSSPRKISFLFFFLVCLTLLLCLPAVAQGPTPMTAETQPSATPMPDAPSQKAAKTSDDDVWYFNVSPYIWVPGIHGTVGALGHDASVHVSGSDVLSNFQGGIAGVFEARKGRLVMPIDLIYVKVATTQGIPLNELGQTAVRAEISQGIFTPKVGYRAVDGEHLKIDALFGLRIWHEGLSLTLRPSQVNGSDSDTWADAVAGGRFQIFFNPKIWITASGDAGGGAASLDYQGVGVINFQPKPLFGFFLGWRYLDVDYVNGNRGFVYDIAQSGPVAGLNMQFGGKPPLPPAATCSVSPAEIWAGDPVTATINTQNFNPKHTITYNWTTTGGKTSGTATTANIDTAGLAPGMYTVTGTATDSKEKKNNVATCNASFMVKTPHPPTATCSASPDTVKVGEPATVTVSASSPDNFPLTYAWSSSAGSVSGTGTSATLNTAGAAEGSTITATATVTDSRGLSTTCNATVNVQAPQVVPPPQVSQIGECNFTDIKRPARVDNTCKAVLDDVALRIRHEQSGKFLVVGNAENNASRLAAQRAVNVKYYLTGGEGTSGIDASRIEPRTGTAGSNSVNIYFVPSGANFTEETTPVDETQVKGQARKAPAPKKRSKKAPAAAAAPTQ